MGSLRSMQLLLTVAKHLEQERLSFSKQEIIKSMNEVKYLSAQKDVPKLTLRKKIIHLEDRLKGVFEFEKKLHQKEKEEKGKMSSLKRQVTILHKKLDACEDQDINQRLGKVSHLIGEFLAKHGTEIDVELSRQLVAELKIKEKKVKVKKSKVKSKEITKQQIITQQHNLTAEEKNRIEQIYRRLQGLKQQIKIDEELDVKDVQQLEVIEHKIMILEEKLEDYYEKYPELVKEHNKIAEVENVVVESPLEVKEEGKHTILLGNNASATTKDDLIMGTGPQYDVKTDQELEEELPLPPPPRMSSK
jgi:hypothetical protein